MISLASAMGSAEITLTLGGSVELRLVQVPAPAEIPTPFVTACFGGFSVTAKGNHMAYVLPIDHLVKVRVDYVDAQGNPASVDADVEWDSSDETLVVLKVDPGDSHICEITPVGPVGNVQVSATADADLGAGIREVITTLAISLVAGEAVAGTITPLGEPEPIAPHPAPIAG